MFTTMPKTTVHTILQEIGIRALREYIYKYLPAPDFHSHDFTRNFEHHFTTQYIQMQGLYAHKYNPQNEALRFSRTKRSLL